MPDFSAAIALLRKPIEDIYNSATGALKEKISHVKTSSKVKNLHKKLYESQKVKTIWNTDRALSLTSFFYPVSIKNEFGESRLTSLDDLPDNHNIIFGTVGQGKSILLRYLLGKEIKSGSRIPVLAELRNIGSESLEEYMCSRFCLLLGIACDSDVFSKFASEGKVSFFLDGFDEVDPGKINLINQQIDDLSYRFERCRIILTSRPDSECRHLTRFSAHKIRPLSQLDLEPFYRKVTRDRDFTNRLFLAINDSPLKIKELVATPLLATLLAISYRAAQRIPLDFSEFYEELFQILLVRHDLSKLGWRRQRKTKLNDREIQQIFEAFCFAARKKKAISFDRDTAYKLAKDSLDETKISSDPQSFIEDIKNITCLLLEEGKKISFVHLSIQEFFASRYVKSLPDSVASIFYGKLANGKWVEWSEELLFLREIDAHRATKYFLIPDIEKTLADLLGERRVVDKDAVLNYLKGMAVSRKIVTRDGKDEKRYSVTTLRHCNTQHYGKLDSIAYEILFTGGNNLAERGWRYGFDCNPDCNQRTYYQIAVDRGGKILLEIEDRIKSAIVDIVRDCDLFLKDVSHAEIQRDFIDID